MLSIFRENCISIRRPVSHFSRLWLCRDVVKFRAFVLSELCMFTEHNKLFILRENPFESYFYSSVVFTKRERERQIQCHWFFLFKSNYYETAGRNLILRPFVPGNNERTIYLANTICRPPLVSKWVAVPNVPPAPAKRSNSPT